MRRFLFHLHSVTGLIAGLCLIVIGLSGSILVFREEIDSLMMPKRVLAAADASSPRLGLDVLIVRVEEQLDSYEPVGWRPSRSPARNDQIFVAPHAGGDPKTLWVDPATGTISESPVNSSETVTGWLLELHYTLLGGHVGVLIAGVFAALLCLLGISGVWIYRNFWRSLFLLRWKLSGRIFFSDLHKMVGISSVAFNLILGFTGAYWNLTHVFGHFLQGPEPEASKIDGRIRAESLSLEGLLQQARAKIPGFEWTYLSLPANVDEPIVFYGRLENQHALRGEFGSSVTFNSQTGDLENLTNIQSVGLWNQITDSFEPLHFGTFGALPIKILWCLGGLAPGVLAITGYILWWKRKRLLAPRDRSLPLLIEERLP
jgi:uncharacterized iron-regulated membrane protein